MRVRYFYFMAPEEDKKAVIRISSKRDPLKLDKGPTCSGTFVAYGFYPERNCWGMLPFPEILPGQLRKLIPLGSEFAPLGVPPTEKL